MGEGTKIVSRIFCAVCLEWSRLHEIDSLAMRPLTLGSTKPCNPFLFPFNLNGLKMHRSGGRRVFETPDQIRFFCPVFQIVIKSPFSLFLASATNASSTTFLPYDAGIPEFESPNGSNRIYVIHKQEVPTTEECVCAYDARFNESSSV